jgi:hypothetical protein
MDASIAPSSQSSCVCHVVPFDFGKLQKYAYGVSYNGLTFIPNFVNSLKAGGYYKVLTLSDTEV